MLNLFGQIVGRTRIMRDNMLVNEGGDVWNGVEEKNTLPRMVEQP